MPVEIVDGDLLDQQVDAIVNPWNRNTIPWWLLLPQGVSGAIKRRAGVGPFRELARHRRMKLGQAVSTGAGRLPFKYIIHVAGINDLWRASERSIRDATRNALRLAVELNLGSVAFPVIGAGSGSARPERAAEWMLQEMAPFAESLHILLVRYRPSKTRHTVQ